MMMLAWLMPKAPPGCVVPSMVRLEGNCGKAEVRVMVRPARDWSAILNTMVLLPPFAIAWVMASRRVLGPLSALLVTVIVAARAWRVLRVKRVANNRRMGRYKIVKKGGDHSIWVSIISMAALWFFATRIIWAVPPVSPGLPSQRAIRVRRAPPAERALSSIQLLTSSQMVLGASAVTSGCRMWTGRIR